jgi:hypothetical protein
VIRRDRLGAVLADGPVMPPPRCLLAILILPLATTSAHADKAEEARTAAKIALWTYSNAAHEAKTTGMFNGFYDEPAKCTAAIEAGTAAGLQPTDTFDGGDGDKMMWKSAPKVCVEYARLRPLRTTIDAIQPAMQTITAFKQEKTSGGSSHAVTGDAYRATVERVKGCLTIIDKAIKDGVPTDIKFAPNHNQGDTIITLTEARGICAEYVAWGGKEATEDDQRVAKELAATTAKYTKVGISGDRLKYLVKWGHRPIWGKGCRELSVKQMKTAPAFYDLGQDDLAWIVYKTEFKKDKQVRYTSKRFRKDGDYSCK